MKFIDLSLTYKNGMQYYPSGIHPEVKITQLGFMKKHKRETRKIEMGTHSGTHIDAPRHFLGGNKSVDSIPIKNLVGDATVLNFSKLKKKTPVCINDVKKIIKTRKFPKMIIFRFDWTDRFYGKKNFYFDHPYLTDTLCNWLVKKKIKLLGVDSPQPDNPKDTLTHRDGINHKILLGNDIVIVEYLTNLKKIKKKNIKFYCCPLKIKDGDGSPARCFASV